MNALLHRFHNFFFPLWQGEDRVCKCSCGSQQAYRVVLYEGAMSTVDSRENFFGGDIMTQQKMDVMGGLFLGFLITWFLMWLNKVWNSKLKFWTADQLNNIHLWSRMPILCPTVDALRQLHPLHPNDTEDLEQEHTAQQPIWTCSENC